MLQGISLKKRRREREREREKMIDAGWPSFFEWGPIALFLKGYLALYIEGNERCKVIQSQPKHSSSFALIKTRVFLHTFSTNDVVYSILALEACEHFMTLLIKAAQPENLFSLKVFFLYISNLCQPQKMPNRVMFFTEQGAVSYKKEPISSKVWYG